MRVVALVVGTVAAGDHGEEIRFPASGAQTYLAHVPKAGGMSLVEEISRILNATLFPRLLSRESMAENRSDYVITQLRAPRQHVISQYMHCRESPMAQYYQQQSRHPFPRPELVADGLAAWIGHDFKVSGSIHFEKHFRCYNPRNMQTRFILGPTSSTKLATAESAAIDVLGTVDVVSVLELMPEM